MQNQNEDPELQKIKNPATSGTFYYLDGLVSTGK
jgi:hypothetical protein